MELINQCYEYLFWGMLVALALCVVAALLYILRSKLSVDRIIGINLISTIVVIIICLLTHVLAEDYLADVAVVYVVMSFIAVMMLCRIYINLYDKRMRERKKQEERERLIREAAGGENAPNDVIGIRSASSPSDPADEQPDNRAAMTEKEAQP